MSSPASIGTRVSFRDRTQLFRDLSKSLETPDSCLLVIFQFTNLDEQLAGLEPAKADEVSSRVAGAFIDAVGDLGTCYRLRGTEFAVLAHDPGNHQSLLLNTSASELLARGVGYEIDVISGSVVLPDEADDPQGAIAIADRHLDLQRRERGIEPEPLLGGASVSRPKEKQSVSGGLPAFFRFYDRVTSEYRPDLGTSSIRVGETVWYRGSRYLMRGVSPASLPERFAELEDLNSAKLVTAPLAEIVPDDS
jgi:GGDEF domain-containing protein